MIAELDMAVQQSALGHYLSKSKLLGHAVNRNAKANVPIFNEWVTLIIASWCLTLKKVKIGRYRKFGKENTQLLLNLIWWSMKNKLKIINLVPLLLQSSQ